jgi:NTE family protein
LRVVVDQLDYPNFPLQGYRFETEAQLGRARYGGQERLVRLTGQGSASATYGRQTVNLQLMAKAASALSNTAVGQFSLGGFQQLSGYRADQITGNALLFGRLGWYTRLAETPVFARGFFLGASLEAGEAWVRRTDMRVAGLRSGGSLYLGADTGIGPMYLGVTWAPRGEAGLALFIGRP